MIVAILSDASKTETLLNNLSEADFNLGDASVIMKDVKLRKAIAKDAGPLKNIALKDVSNELVKKAGLSQEAAKRCRQAIEDGHVLVVMNVADQYLPAAREMFQDQSAQLINK
jgi:hypothetical protein